MIEEWKDIPGYEGMYAVSNLGRVKSLPRTTEKGRKWAGGLMTGSPNKNGHLQVGLYKNKRTKYPSIHSLVMIAFVGPRQSPEIDICHWDGDPANNRLDNLRYDTKTANRLDDIRNGVNKQALSTHCKHGHEFHSWNNAKNKRTYGNGRRSCRACSNARSYARNKGMPFSIEIANEYYNKLMRDNT